MPIAGPSRLGASEALAARSTATASISASLRLRQLSSASSSKKPHTLAREPSYSSSIADSIALTSKPLSQQRARQRISDVDAQLGPASPSHFLRDRHSRQHTYLRLSLTEKCNLRCLYCMPEDGVPLTPSANLLSTSEVERLAALFVSQGVNKIRLTGGEPTVRSDLPQIVASLNSLKQHGLEQIGITTNGIALGRRKLDTLVQNGLTHLNVSLDTLDPFKFEFMTRRRGHEAVMDCIERALALGVPSVKINVVVLKGLNDTKDVVDFVRFTKDKPITIRFIEYMPFDGNKWQVQKLVPYRDLVKTIQQEFPTFERVANRDDPNDTSKHWRVPGHLGTVGFITRLRITADGNLKVCLFGNAEVSLRDAMRTGFGPIGSLSTGSNGEPATDEHLLQLIGAAVGRKHAKHAGMRDPTELANALMRRSSGRVTAGFGAKSLMPRRTFHSPARREQKKQDDEEDDDDNPWGDLDRAFENLEDKSLYKQVFLKHPFSGSAPPASSTTQPRDPIAEMEEAIFAQAGAAAVKTTSRPSRASAVGTLSGVTFSDAPPSAAPSGGYPASLSRHDLGASSTGSSAKWSEYMHDGDAEDDSPWSSLDAFVDNPDSSAQYAVPLHLQNQQSVMRLSAQQHAPPAVSPQLQQPQQRFDAREAFAANDDLLRQQIQLQTQSNQEHDTEEEMFARAGAAAVAQLLNQPTTPTSSNAVDAEDSTRLSHVDPATGGASMVDVSHKPTTSRSATAVGRVYLPTSASHLLLATESQHGISNKGPVLHTAQLAGIMAAKRTADLIPLCHPLPLTHVDVKLDIVHGEEESWIEVECTATTAGQTGVEMEALTGCTTACLTVWDMVKAVAGKTMRIGDVMVVRKRGGKSGDWVRRQ
ncbi:related to Molybdopterin biosynthesis CNX2 protein [Sporisorium reilianum f. sp. reilianum]|uniref:Related to Molybdopterin biosynthesis CNX2 protein n=1 Tax=Sporisorium reilianum f. sp. reilianum TaxID=72559 RepID=A0A2N8U516_9BASI|nr:related to Molybdopterin biosynthesis CNX2 protein [Sporisorium reilianum f. sp. reilianum]